jgi:acetylornithine deacetylase/succinyl-diaminopimelate desuccinylase-like protein
LTGRVLAAASACLLLAVLSCSRSEPARPKNSLEADETRPAQEWLKDERVRLLRDYVRIDTTTEGKGEKEGAEFLKEFFDCAGIENEIVCPKPGRCNLLARLPGRRRDGALLLLNHIDVAETVPGSWKEAEPFGGEIKRGYLYGRGAYDMKSIAIAQALAMRRLKERGIVPGSDILFLAEADEEVGQKWGSKWLLEHRPEWFSGVCYVLNEGGTNEMILRDVRYWGLETIQAGYAVAEFGSAEPAPLESLAARWKSLDGPAVAAHPHVVIGFGMLANHLGNPLTDPLRHLDRVARDRAELRSLPDRYGAFLEARIHWWGPFPAPEAKGAGSRILVTVFVPPGVDARQYLDPILKSLPKGVRIVRQVVGDQAGASPYPTPFTDLIARVTEAYSPGIPFGPMPTVGGYTTSVIFRHRGFPTYGYSPIAMNITDSVRRHGIDERLFLRDYLRGCDLYADIVEEFALFAPGEEMSCRRPAR